MKINSKDFRRAARRDDANASMFSVVLTAVDGSERSAGVFARGPLRLRGRVQMVAVHLVGSTVSSRSPQEFPRLPGMPLDKLPNPVERRAGELQGSGLWLPGRRDRGAINEASKAWRASLSWGSSGCGSDRARHHG